MKKKKEKEKQSKKKYRKPTLIRSMDTDDSERISNNEMDYISEFENMYFFLASHLLLCIRNSIRIWYFLND